MSFAEEKRMVRVRNERADDIRRNYLRLRARRQRNRFVGNPVDILIRGRPPGGGRGLKVISAPPDLDRVLGDDSGVFKYHFGVTEEGNCDPRHDIQGELRGQVR